MFYPRAMKWFAVMLTGLLLPVATRAFTMTPTMTDVAIEPGTSYVGNVDVGNDEKIAQTYYISIQKFIPKGEEGQQEFLPPSETAGLPNWISFDRASFTLKPGESKRLPYAIKVPANAAPGGYYAVTFFSNVPPGENADHITIGSRAGMLLFVTVKGQLTEQMSLTDFALETPAAVDRLPVSFRVTVQNEGNVHILPEGTLTIRNVFGSTVARLPLNRSRNRVLPNAKRRLALDWYNEMPKEGSGFWHDAGEEWKNFAIGPYQATLELSSPSVVGPSVQTVRFSIWPWRLGVLLVVGIGLLLFLARFYKRSVIARATRA